MTNFNLSNKYDLIKINETLDKFVNIQKGGNVTTLYDGKELCSVEVSEKYYNFDFSDFCKKVVSEIENYFIPDAYLLRVRSGIQELRLVGSEVDINGEAYLKMIGIINSTNKERALSMNIGLVRKSNVTSSVHVSFRNKHYKSSMPNKIQNFSDNLINFNMDIEYHIKTIEDLSKKDIDFRELVDALSTNKDGERIKSMYLKVRALGKKLIENGYSNFVNILRNPFSDTVEQLVINSKDIFDAYTELFKNSDSAIIGRETRRILDALDKCSPIIGMYLYQNSLVEEEMTDTEKIEKYFKCQFGDNITLNNVYTFERMEEYCEYNGYSKEFVIETMKNKLALK